MAAREFPRTLRLNTQLREELAILIRDSLSDPRVTGVTITSVDVAPDLRSARVRASVLGDDARLAVAVAGLNRAAGRLRSALSKRLHLRRVPELRFEADGALRQAERVSALIRKVTRRDADEAAGDD
ncbi:30S ribosome-binding factor RbfA [Sinimarinibacterium thermocellulolyticum]|uniref:Ribosome-binding factor A n=1 Tax=Sinimarinibacterium thermocellulolyticum TaxID=3170016 RepID=A0ABV2A8T3_9GAMM